MSERAKRFATYPTPVLAQALDEAITLLKQCEPYVWSESSEVVDGVRQVQPGGIEARLWVRLTDFIKEQGGYDDL